MKNIKNQNIFWTTYTIELKKASIISKSLIIMAINDFWSNIVNHINDNKHINVLFRFYYK